MRSKKIREIGSKTTDWQRKEFRRLANMCIVVVFTESNIGSIKMRFKLVSGGDCRSSRL